MKENVIIGKLIPAGTGMKRYRNIQIDSGMPEAEEFTEESYEYDAEGMIETIEIEE